MFNFLHKVSFSHSASMSVLQMVSLLMIGIAAWGKWFGLVSSFQVVGGIIGVGVFLFFVALAGLIGAMKHHQVLLFFVSFTNSSYDCSFCTFIHNLYKMSFSNTNSILFLHM